MSDDRPDPFADIEPPDWTLVARYLAGEASVGDRAVLGAWLADDPRRRVWLDAVRDAWQAAGRPVVRGVDGDAFAASVWARVRRTEVAAERATGEHAAPQSAGARAQAQSWPGRVGEGARGSAVWWAMRLAAGIVVVAAGSLAVWRAGWPVPAQQFREFASARGSRTTITLRDGTTLVLGPATRLRVPSDFGRSERTVELEGEAQFAVVHDARHPFAVRTARATVRDVGTTFVVRAYAEDAVERVAVTEGEVAIASVTLGAHDRASIDAGGRVAVHRGVDLTIDVAWVHGGLVFKDTPLRDVAREVARTYDVDVTIADSTLAAKPITASFRDEPVDAVLREVAFVAGAQYDRTGRSVVIRRSAFASEPTGSGSRIRRAVRSGAHRALTLNTEQSE